MKAKTVVFLSAVVTAIGVRSADIEWTMSPNTTADSEIRNDGRCLYAYTASPTEVNVNGVQFGRFRYSTDSFAGDVTLDQQMSWLDVWMTDREEDWTAAGGSTEHLNLLKYGWYKNVPENRTRTFTLTGLVPGRRYLVQLWMCDARDQTKATKTLTLGGVTGNCYADGFGCCFTGLFTADAATQAISLVYGSEGQLNAFQVRCLDEAHITWTGGYTSGESDIRTDGSPVYAYKPGDSLCIRGTEFTGVSSGNVSSFGADVFLSRNTGSLFRKFCATSESVPSGAYSYTPAYSNFVSTAHYANWTKVGEVYYIRRDVTLKNLRAGFRYLVQLWTFDNRDASYSDRSVVVGNGVVVKHCDGTQYGHGGYAVGIFTAVSSEQVFSCYHRASKESMVSGQETLGPIQVRCLDEEYEGWTVGSTAADGSVDTRGVSVCAYAATATEVSGTRFQEYASDGYMFNEIALLTNGVVHAQVRNKSAFIIDATVPVSQAVTNLLAGALYQDDGASSQEVVVRNLLPGRRYLVQAWFMDARKDRSGNFAGKSFQYRDLGTAPLGQYVTGVFRAMSSTHSIPFATKNGQLNAIQVRQLDSPAASLISWSCAETESGESSVSTEGTQIYGYAPWAYSLANGVAFSEGAGNATAWGDGDVVLSQPYGLRHDKFAADEYEKLFKYGWYHSSTVSAGETPSWTITIGNLTPSHEYVVQLFVADLRNLGSGVRRMSIGGDVGRYGPNNDGKSPYGSVFTGRFTADAKTKSFAVHYPDGIASAQLNAIQVREIGTAGAVWTGPATGTWATDGANWTERGVDKTGTTLWNESEGVSRVAWIGQGVDFGLGADVTAGGIFGSGAVTVGLPATEKRLSIASEVAAPTATVNAVWDSPVIAKTLPGTTVFAGKCPHLTSLVVSDGRVVLDGEVSHALKISVIAPGQLGFSAMRALPWSAFSGDGTLAGPGGIELPGGEEVALPAGLEYADGFAWGLKNDAVAVLPDGCDASRLVFRVDNPAAYKGRICVRAAGSVSGKPKFILPDKSWRCYWNDELSGWVPVGKGLFIVFR